MSLVKHKKGFRHTWMIPRPKRYLDPYKFSKICCEIEKTLSDEWSGNIENQKSFTKSLENQNLKKQGEQYDLNSGGPRTYLNQLECLGLIFKNNKNYYLTISGELIVSGIEPKKILQHNLLKLQYPSPYSKNPNCNINPKIKIKPFMFILDLLLDKRVKSLNDYELILIVAFGHNDQCKELCIKKILQFRKYKNFKDGLKKILLPFKKYLITSKTSKNTIDKIIDNLKDNANTFGNYLQGVDLVKEVYGSKPKTLEFNLEYLKVFDDAKKNTKYLKITSNEQFQRIYGKYLNKKDTRSLDSIKKIKGKILEKNHMVKLKFFELEELFADQKQIPESFYNDLYEGYSIKKEEVNEIINPLIQNYFDDNLRDFLLVAKSGKKYHLQFEKEIVKIFRNYFGFISHHTGQIKRDSEEGGGYSDILIVSNERNLCALLDGKAIKNYSLPNTDRLNMINNYIPNFNELVLRFEHKNLSLKFVSYVASSINHNSNIQKWCIQISKKCNNLPVSVISADDLAKLALKYKGRDNQNEIINIFLKTGIIQLN